MIFQRRGSDNLAFELWVFIGMILFFQYSYISPMPAVILIGFIGTGIGGKLLENVTTRWSWIKPALIISVVSWLIGYVYFTTLGNSAPNTLWKSTEANIAVAVISICVGGLIASIAGILFNPTKRLFRLVIGSVASIVVGYLIGFMIFAAQTN